MKNVTSVCLSPEWILTKPTPLTKVTIEQNLFLCHNWLCLDHMIIHVVHSNRLG